MSRPLIVTDCDEVLLHMITHYRDWLAESQEIDFDLTGPNFVKAMRRKDSGRVLEPDEIWDLLNRFFDTEMHRQTLIPGAAEAMAALAEDADVVVLTNLADHRRDDRTRQLATHGLDLRVYTNQGPKGPALKAIIEEYRPSRVLFIDDIAHHHASAAEMLPDVTRLHLVGEPLVAPHVPCGLRQGHAHARIDNWAEALPWLLERMN
jgi:hypothetical protein